MSLTSLPWVSVPGRGVRPGSGDMARSTTVATWAEPSGRAWPRASPSWTREMYGNGASEWIIGEILREGGFEGRPVIATKFAPLPYRFSAKSLLKAVDKSLERLGIETIDLYQIHFPNPIFKINSLMDALSETVKAGKVRRVGVSNYGADQMQRAHDRLASHGV